MSELQLVTFLGPEISPPKCENLEEEHAVFTLYLEVSSWLSLIGYAFSITKNVCMYVTIVVGIAEWI
jgi:hypothetical protein